MNREISKQLDRLENLAYRVRVNGYTMEYLGEWIDRVAKPQVPDKPGTSDALKVNQYGYLKQHFAHYREIMAQAMLDAEQLDRDLMDVRQQIAEALHE